MRGNKIILSTIFLFCLSCIYAQDTTIIKTDKIKSSCFCVKGIKLYRTKNSLDSSCLKHCKDYDFSKIDLSKNNLISILCTSGGCAPPIVNCILYKIASEKKYLFLIKIAAQGKCKANIPIPIVELVPKLENDYIFEYTVEESSL